MDGLYVRKELVNNIFGYQDVSFQNFPIIKNHPRLKLAVGMLEKFWKDIVSRYKAIIVVLTGDVSLGNMISNMVGAWSRGVDPITFAKQTMEAWKFLDQYEEDNIALQEAIIMQKGNPTVAGKNRIKGLQRRLENNPMHVFIQDGQYIPIVEDINAEKVVEKSYLDKFANKISNRSSVGKAVITAKDLLFVNEKTSLFRKALKIVQYSDITSRYVIHKHNIETKGMNIGESLADVDQFFVNYAYNDNRFVKFVNVIGAILFTKYYTRVPKALYKAFKANPALNIFIQGLQGASGVDISDAYDSYYSPIDAFINRIQDPIGILSEVGTMNVDNIFPSIDAVVQY
jgi:hypothetical protein